MGEVDGGKVEGGERDARDEMRGDDDCRESTAK